MKNLKMLIPMFALLIMPIMSQAQAIGVLGTLSPKETLQRYKKMSMLVNAGDIQKAESVKGGVNVLLKAGASVNIDKSSGLSWSWGMSQDGETRVYTSSRTTTESGQGIYYRFYCICIGGGGKRCETYPGPNTGTMVCKDDCVNCQIMMQIIFV